MWPCVTLSWWLFTNCVPADGDVSLDGDGERHVDGGAEGHGGHGVQEVDVDLGEHEGLGEPQIDSGEGGIQVDGNIEYDISEFVKFETNNLNFCLSFIKNFVFLYFI